MEISASSLSPPPPLSLSLRACVRACVCYIDRGNNCKIKANWTPINALLESRSRKLQTDGQMVIKTIIKASFAPCERTWSLEGEGTRGDQPICCGDLLRGSAAGPPPQQRMEPTWENFPFKMSMALVP